eukprot:scaffold10474_cov122-Isochrysis_galbana.AAC.12
MITERRSGIALGSDDTAKLKCNAIIVARRVDGATVRRRGLSWLSLHGPLPHRSSPWPAGAEFTETLPCAGED